MNKNDDNRKCIKGIACDVCNCRHNDGECHCTAGKISVGPSFASCCSETVCATFEAND